LIRFNIIFPAMKDSTASSIDAGHDVEKAAPPAALDWDGPDDPENPRNWSTPRKVFAIIVPGLMAFAV
jgi:hypothetical protein